jgi:MFS family permease
MGSRCRCRDHVSFRSLRWEPKALGDYAGSARSGDARRIKGLRLVTAFGLAALLAAVPGIAYGREMLLGTLAAGFALWASVSEAWVIADIMRDTGRYNLAQGAIATVQGIGASLSGLAAGVIVDHFGYSAAFLTLGPAALVAVIVFAIWMPKTTEQERHRQSREVCSRHQTDELSRSKSVR